MSTTMKKTRNIYLDRFEKFVSDIYFKDVNLKGKIYPTNHPVKKLSHYAVKDTHYRPLFKEVVTKHLSEFVDLDVGKDIGSKSFGPSWSTHWFYVEMQVPQDYAGKEVHFLWNSNSEAMIYDVNGTPLQGLTGDTGDDQRHEFILLKEEETKGGELFKFYIEMACNGMFGTGLDGLINPPDEKKTFTLSKCHIAVFDRLAYELMMDFLMISDMASEMDEKSNRANQALYTANEMINTFDHTDKKTWAKAREIAAKFLNLKNGESQHLIHAVGHCHIDVGWLWPYGETRRKAARSWASQVLLMKDYPKYVFAQSQAQLYEWVKQDYPQLYESIKQKVKDGQFVPVGGTWVENCGILPGGESMVRQFLYGQKFFKKEFGMYCTEFWLPDSFGYSGQLPQIMLGSNIEHFVTQKLSWNIINKFPNNTMIWEGIDKRSKVIAHFPPQDSYVSRMKVKELLYNVSNFKDKDRCNCSLALFGFGDGGGGPDRHILKRVEKSQNVDGLPKVEFSTAKKYFENAKQEHKEKPLMNWEGELYFELHRGTYTSQASTKKGNRKGEFLLRDVEILSVLASELDKQFLYPKESLEKMWKNLLLNQFHDVLPGSSIKLVYDDALKIYEEIQKEGTTLKLNALKALTESGNNDAVTVFNTLGWSRMEVLELPESCSSSFSIQKAYNGKPLAIVNAVPIGYRKNTKADSITKSTVTANENTENITLENSYLSLSIQKTTGLITLYDKRANRYAVKNGNQFVMYDDVPMFWDAWDVEIYHLEKQSPINPSSISIKLIETGPLRAAIQLGLQLTTTSTLKQIITLTSISPRIDFHTEIEWTKEARKMLKVQFPTTIRSPQATYETQFGHLQRPTHFNTSWDVAKFECHAQKYVTLNEHNYGVAVLNDCKYGYSVYDNTISLSLLRAPKAPDDECDMGHHSFTYSLYPHVSTFQSGKVVQESYNLNTPLAVMNAVPKASDQFSLLSVEGSDAIVVEAIKKAEDDDNKIVVRFYEAYGGHVSDCKFKVPYAIKCATVCNLLEEETKEQEGIEVTCDGTEIDTRNIQAFEIKSMLIEIKHK